MRLRSIGKFFSMRFLLRSDTHSIDVIVLYIPVILMDDLVYSNAMEHFSIKTASKTSNRAIN